MAQNKIIEAIVDIAGSIDPSLGKSVDGAIQTLGNLNLKAIAVSAAIGGIAVATGKAVVAAGKYLADLGGEFDQATDTIRIGTGATGEALEALTQDFDAVYKSVPTTMEEAGKAIADYNTLLGLTGSELQNISKQAIQVSGMLGDDLTGVIQESSHALEQWGVDSQNMGSSMDYIFKVSQSTGIGFTDLMGKMQQFGPQLQEMGYSFQTAATLMGQLEKAGVNTDEVLAALKKSVTAMAKEGINASEGIEVYFEQIKNAGTAAEATAKAAELFGARAGSTMASAIRDGTLAVSELTAELLANGETISGAAEDTYDFGERLQMMRQNLEAALKPISNTVFDGLNKFIPVLQQLMEKLIPTISEAVDAAIPFIDEFLSGGAKLLEEMLPILSSLADEIMPVISTFVENLFPPLLELLRGIVPPLMQIIEAILPPVLELLSYILPIVTNIANAVLPALTEIIAALMPVITPILDMALQILNEVIMPLLPAITDIVMTLLPPIISILNSILPILNPVFEILRQIVTEVIVPMIPQLMELVYALLPPILGILDAIMPIIPQILGFAMQILNDVIMPLLPSLMQLVNSLLPPIVSILNSLLPIIQPLLNLAMQILRDVVMPLIPPIMKLVDALLPPITELLNDLMPVLSPLLNILQPIADVLSTIVGWISKVISFGSDIIGKLTGISKSSGGGTAGYAAGGFTNGLSLVGEDPRYPREAVISFNPAYRAQNLDYWARAGQMLGADDGSGNKIILDTTNTTVVYDLGGLSFSPRIELHGNTNENELLKMLKDLEPEFIDFILEALRKREEDAYVGRIY